MPIPNVSIPNVRIVLPPEDDQSSKKPMGATWRRPLAPTSPAARRAANEHLGQLKEPDHLNASTALQLLNLQENQPVGYRPVHLRLRPNVYRFFQTHQFQLHDIRRQKAFYECDVIV